MTVKNLNDSVIFTCRPALRRSREADRVLLFSLFLSLLIHAAVGVLLFFVAQPPRFPVFMLVQSGEEALEMEIGSAFESAESLPRPIPETPERRIEQLPPERPSPEREIPSKTDFHSAAVSSLSEASVDLSPAVVSSQLTRQARNRYEHREPPEPARPQALSAPPAPASVASRLGAADLILGVREQAHPLQALAPRYPESSRRRGETGVVMVRAIIDASGRCQLAHLEASSGFLALDRAALEAVRRALYSPARQDGMAVQSEKRFEIDFRLR